MTIQAEVRCRAGGAPVQQLLSVEVLMAQATDDELSARQRDPAFWRELAARWHHLSPEVHTRALATVHYERAAKAFRFPAPKKGAAA